MTDPTTSGTDAGTAEQIDPRLGDEIWVRAIVTEAPGEEGYLAVRIEQTNATNRERSVTVETHLSQITDLNLETLRLLTTSRQAADARKALEQIANWKGYQTHNNGFDDAPDDPINEAYERGANDMLATLAPMATAALALSPAPQGDDGGRKEWLENAARYRTRAPQGEGRQDGWQDIATAPKDGTRFLAYFPETNVASANILVIQRHDPGGALRNPKHNYECWIVDGFITVRGEPTLWRPLPAPPLASAPAPQEGE